MKSWGLTIVRWASPWKYKHTELELKWVVNMGHWPNIYITKPNICELCG